jgi:hypothetical protein
LENPKTKSQLLLVIEHPPLLILAESVLGGLRERLAGDEGSILTIPVTPSVFDARL